MHLIRSVYMWTQLILKSCWIIIYRLLKTLVFSVASENFGEFSASTLSSFTAIDTYTHQRELFDKYDRIIHMTNLNNTCSYATAVKSSLCWNIVPNEVKDYFQFSPNEATMYISTPFTPQDGMVIVSQFPKHEAITSARPSMNYRGIYFAGTP